MYVSMKNMLEKAAKEGYAVMAINCFNLETVRTVINAAEAESAPIIVNIYHDHMMTHCDSEIIAPIVKTLAERASVEVALNYDHGIYAKHLIKAIDDGFSSVMADASRFDLDGNIAMTKEIVDYAHQRGVSVEGEIGSLGASDGSELVETPTYTNPYEAKTFVEKTGVDVLAVSIGTSHGNYPKGTIPDFDMERLRKIRSLVPVPLALHGGSGSGEANIVNCIKNGISKINVGCDFMNSNRAATWRALQADLNINYFDLIQYVEKGSAETVRYYIRLSGSAQKSLKGND